MQRLPPPWSWKRPLQPAASRGRAWTAWSLGPPLSAGLVALCRLRHGSVAQLRHWAAVAGQGETGGAAPEPVAMAGGATVVGEEAHLGPTSGEAGAPATASAAAGAARAVIRLLETGH